MTRGWQIYWSLLTCGTQLLIAYAAWQAFIYHRAFWALLFAVMFGVLAVFSHPRRELVIKDTTYAAVRNRPGNHPRRR